MQPQFEATCERCGGPGVSFTPNYGQVHRDPNVCTYYLSLRLAEAIEATPAKKKPPQEEQEVQTVWGTVPLEGPQN